MKKSYTRMEIQTILESNPLNVPVSYLDRDNAKSPFDNWIVYSRSQPNNPIYSDDMNHIRKIELLITHFHKTKLSNISDFIYNTFGVFPTAYGIQQFESDYWATYYRFEIIAIGEW
jgi:hypothetical protein